MSKGKRIAKPGNLASSPATSRTPLKIELDPELIRQLRALDRDARREIGETINQIGSALGLPHRHAGLGLRKLRGPFFEGRIGLKRRLIFETSSDGILYFHLMGSHEDVRKFIKSH
jgi:mRNA-degrading endonuclease RelE of RelBE toxin-antitoxin system